MGTKHTKGPWHVLDGAILCEHVNDYGNFLIASFGRGDAPNTPEVFANARLIAAAPELLEACKEGLNAIATAREVIPDVDMEGREIVEQLEQQAVLLETTIALAEAN